MISRGAPTDIRTGLPVEHEPTGEKQAKKAAQLEDKIKYLGLSKTEAGQELIKLIEDVLTGRINQILFEDEQAKAMTKILTDIGGKELTARSAAAKYIKTIVA